MAPDSILPAMLYRSLILVLAVVVMVGCNREANKWTEADAAERPDAVTVAEKGGDARIVLFAPINIGDLKPIYPQANVDYAHDMANRIDLLVNDADGRVGETLPPSGDPAWDKGRVAAAGGAHLVVLTKVLELRRFEGPPSVSGRQTYQVAVVDFRAVDVDGRLVMNKQIKGQVEVRNNAKFSGPMNEPESLATWQALSTGCGLIKEYLDKNPDLRVIPKQRPTDGINQIEVTFDSVPAQADIIVDGAFRGTTPQKIMLPEKDVTISIERQGYQKWTRTLKPVVGMRIQPALEPLPAKP